MEPITTLAQMLRLRVEDMMNAPGCRMEWIQLMREAADELDRLEEQVQRHNRVGLVR